MNKQFIILFLFPFLLYSQKEQNNLDSLIKKVELATEDSTKAKTYIDIAVVLRQKHPDSARRLCNKAIKIIDQTLLIQNTRKSKRKHYLNIKADALQNIGMIAQMHSKLDEAEKNYLKAIEILLQIRNKSKLSNVYNYLSRVYEWKGNYDAFFNITKKAYRIQKNRTDSMGQAMSLIALGSYYERFQDIDSCIESYESALSILRKLSKGGPLSYGLFEYAHVLKRLERYQETVELLFESLEIYEENENTFQKVKTLSSIGLLFKEMKESEKAEEYLKRALLLSKQLKNKNIESNILNNLGLVYASKGMNKKSLSYHLDAYHLTKKAKSVPVITAKLLNNIGEQYFELQQYKQAIDYLEQALQVGTEKPLVNNTILFSYNLAKSYWANQQKNLAKIYAKKAFTMATDNDSKEMLLQTASLLYRIYKQEKITSSALHYLEVAKNIEGSIQKENTQAKLIKREAQFQLDKKDLQIQNLENKQRIKELTLTSQETIIEQQRKNQTLLLLGILLIISIGLLLFNRYRLQKENKELALQAKQLELEKEQEQNNQQLEIAKLRSDFFTDVSHEFRTPLSLILAPLEKLLKGGHKDIQKDLERINQNSKQLLRLVNETLDLSKIETGHLPLRNKTHHIGDFIKKITQSFAPRCETKGISINFEDNSSNYAFSFDSEKMYKVMVNLIDNAFKHSQTGDQISIVINAPKNKEINIMVIDNGTGIKTNDLPYIFDRFYRGNSEIKGTGIGLALSKQLIELHNGSITVKSAVNKGSCFSVLLPVVQIEAKNLPSKKVSTPSQLNTNKGKTILIVEDHQGVRDYLEELLEEYDLFIASNGKEGVALAEENNPDLIITDIMMPYMDGIELCIKLKENFNTSHIPIILLTAKASIENKLIGLKNGADDYINKPFSPDELKHRVNNLILQREHLRNLFSTNYFISPKKLTENILDQRFLEKARQIIEKNINNHNFSVELFSKEIGLNRSGVHLKLKALTGKNTSQFIKAIRLKTAATLILESNQSISEVIDSCGFGSRQAFNKSFKTQFKMTPSEFKTLKSRSKLPS